MHSLAHRWRIGAFGAAFVTPRRRISPPGGFITPWRKMASRTPRRTGPKLLVTTGIVPDHTRYHRNYLLYNISSILCVTTRSDSCQLSVHFNRLYICATSRPEVDIRAVLQPLAFRSVSLHDETGQKTDIAHYIRNVVNSSLSVAMRRWRSEDRSLVIETLTERADGM